MIEKKNFALMFFNSLYNIILNQIKVKKREMGEGVEIQIKWRYTSKNYKHHEFYLFQILVNATLN